MKRIPLSIPEVALIAGTRAALGAGVALLVSPRLSRAQRQAAGWALCAVGAISTVPIVLQMLKSSRESCSHDSQHLGRDQQLRRSGLAARSPLSVHG